jgi:hypothetical protein
VAKGKAQFELTIGALDKFTKPFEAFGKEVSEATGKLEKYGKEMSVAKKRISTALGIPKITKNLKDLGAGFGQVAGGVKDFGLRLAGMGLAAGGAVAGLYALTRVYTDAGDEAVKAAQKAGISTSAWQEMAYAASLSDVSNEQLIGGYQKLNKAMVAGANGGKAQVETFKKLGITLKNSKGELRATDSVMLEVADAFAKMPEGAQKTALAMELFGKSGAALLPLLNGGKDGLMEQRREAEKLGLVMGGDAAKASEEFNDNVTRLESRFKGLGMIIGGSLLPAFSDFVEMMSNLIDENRELIKVKVTEYAAKIQKAMPAIKEGIKSVVGILPKALGLIEKIATLLGPKGTAAVGFAAIFGGPTITIIGGFMKMLGPMAGLLTNIWGLFKGIGFALGHLSGFLKIAGYAFKALALNPVGLILMAFAGALALVINYFGGFDKWLALVKDGLSLFVSDVKDAAIWVGEKLSAAFSAVIDFLQPVIDGFKSIGSAIIDFLAPAFNTVMEFLQPLIDKIKDFLGMIEKVTGFSLGSSVGEAVYGEIKDEDQLHKEELNKQRTEMLRRKEAGEISHEQYKTFMTNSYASNPVAASPLGAPTGVPMGAPAMAGSPIAPGTQETTHTEIKEEKVNMTLTLPPGVSLTPSGGQLPNNVSVSGRATTLGVANTG